MNKKNEAIMKLFKSYLIECNNEKEMPTIDKEALKKGIYIKENCPKDIIDLACDLWGKDGYLLNQTFHKSFNTVIETSQEELIIQQIIHYITTYGFEEIGEYNEKFVYIPNEKLEVPELKNDIKLIEITQISKENLKERLLKLCESSIPLSKETIEYISELSDYMEITKDNINIIKNKEIKTVLYSKLGILPEEPEEFFRYLIYSLIGKTLIIKDKTTIQSLKRCDRKKALDLIVNYNKQYSIKYLAEIFNRYKPLFLALKTNQEVTSKINNIYQSFKKNENIVIRQVQTYGEDEMKLNTIINKISRLSKKYHKPMSQNDLDIFVDWCSKHALENDFEEQLKEKIKKAGIWRTIKLKNYLQYEKINSRQHVYKIRNGKAWIQNNYKELKYNPDNVLKILDAIIIAKMKNNVDGKKVYLDNNFDLKLPQSEKQFVGNIPFGSSLTVDKENLMFGIQWFNTKNERVDLDLKLISNNYAIGWNAEYNETDKLIFSGDVTDAPFPNGAAEYIYIDKTIGETIFSLKVNDYTDAVDNIQYDIIIAKGNKSKLKQNYIIDPNDIIARIPKNKIEKGKAEHSIGTIIIDGQTIKIVFTDLCTSNRIFSANNELEDVLRKYIEKESQCKCNLRDYLERAGAIITNDSELADINLSINNLNKDSLISLFL